MPDEKITLDRGVAEEMLSIGNTGVALCERIIEKRANAEYIARNTLLPGFEYMKRELLPRLSAASESDVADDEKNRMIEGLHDLSIERDEIRVECQGLREANEYLTEQFGALANE